MPQRNLDGDDDRSPMDQARFKRALKGINTWYGHVKTHVLLVTLPLPTGHEYTNLQPYGGRGWCVAEQLMSAIVKDQDALIDMSKLKGDETTVAHLVINGKSDRPPPMAPDAFHEMLTSGVEDGTIKFTNSGDVSVVAKIYERAFVDEMSAATSLEFGSLGWGDEQMATLCRALTSAQAMGAMANLEVLLLDDNQVGDAGCIALAKALGTGAMAQLRELHFMDNKIGDAGMTALAGAVARGSLPQLQLLRLDSDKVGDQGMIAFAESLGNGALAQLRKLYLGDNEIGEPGMTALAGAIARGGLPVLKDLYMFENAPALEAACKTRGFEYH